MVLGLELDSLQVENNIGHVFDYAGQRGELVLRAGDLHRGDCRAFERRQEHATKGISDRVAVAGLKWLGHKFCISFSG